MRYDVLRKLSINMYPGNALIPRYKVLRIYKKNNIKNFEWPMLGFENFAFNLRSSRVSVKSINSYLLPLTSKKSRTTMVLSNILIQGLFIRNMLRSCKMFFVQVIKRNFH